MTTLIFLASKNFSDTFVVTVLNGGPRRDETNIVVRIISELLVRLGCLLLSPVGLSYLLDFIFVYQRFPN